MDFWLKTRAQYFSSIRGFVLTLSIVRREKDIFCKTRRGKSVVSQGRKSRPFDRLRAGSGAPGLTTKLFSELLEAVLVAHTWKRALQSLVCLKCDRKGMCDLFCQFLRYVTFCN